MDSGAKGTGTVLVVNGPAGVGKSTLLAHAGDMATERGFTVLTSCLTPMSATWTHAVVRDWVGPMARARTPGEKPFDGPAQQLWAAVSGRGGAPDGGLPDPLVYELVWLLDNLSAEAPVLLVVDDAQWADSGSLQLLDLVAARAPASGCVLLLSRSSGEPAQRPELLQRIGARGSVLTIAALSVDAVTSLREEMGLASTSPIPPAAELHRLTGGVPFLVRELLDTPLWNPEHAPTAVVDSVRDRLSRLDPRCVDVARSVAVLDDEADLDAVADLCDTTVAALADPMAVLIEAGLVTPGHWQTEPATPLIALAVLDTMTPSQRSQSHMRAAARLHTVGKPLQVVAGHLLHTLPEDDPGVVELLRAAAAASAEAGHAALAAAQLWRAVGETRPEDTDSSLLEQAARAQLRAGLPLKAIELWQRALDRPHTPTERGVLLSDMAEAQMYLGDQVSASRNYLDASKLLQDEGHDSSSPTLRKLLGRMARAQHLPADVVPVLDRATAQVKAQPERKDTHADRLLFALESIRLAMEGRDADEARALALRACADGRLLEEETSEGSGYHMAAAACVWSDSFEEGFTELDAAVAQSAASSSVRGFGAASTTRGLMHLRQGHPRHAVADLEAALAMRARGWQEYVATTLAALVLAHIDLDQLHDADTLEPALREAAAGSRDVMAAFALSATGALAAARGDHTTALADLQRAADLTAVVGGSPAVVAWRELTSRSLLAAGRRREAEEMAREAVEHARTWGSRRSLGLALTCLAETEPSASSTATLREAVTLLDAAGTVDLLARARAALGGHLVRLTATREEGIALLHLARAYAQEEGIPSLVERVSDMLARHGVSVAEPVGSPLNLLTPGERRVVELAVSGVTNREIAHELTVTVKAVEWHLSRAYKKLSIRSRRGLVQALGGSGLTPRLPPS
jgi:DNA-binding CsgD family transcriptional regulator/tetratricopeptide (TPR) repeat protein